MKPYGKRILFFTAGSLALSAGVIGIFLPVLPTTPFLLLASFCFVRSSERIHQWLIQHPVFGDYINNYMTHKGITKADRRKALCFLWLTLGLTIIFSNSLHLRVALAVIGSLVTAHLMRLRVL